MSYEEMGFRLKSSIFDARKMRKEASNCGNSAVMVRRRAISGKGSSPEEPIGPRMWHGATSPLPSFRFISPTFLQARYAIPRRAKGETLLYHRRPFAFVRRGAYEINRKIISNSIRESSRDDQLSIHLLSCSCALPSQLVCTQQDYLIWATSLRSTLLEGAGDFT